MISLRRLFLKKITLVFLLGNFFNFNFSEQKLHQKITQPLKEKI